MELHQRRSAVLSELDHIVYPVLTLPPEITAEIFKWCTVAHRKPNAFWSPQVLTEICRDWRTLAVSTPSLWDTITEMDIHTGGYPVAEAIIETWFSRAGARPLSLDIICIDPVDSPRLESIILRHAPHLQSFELVTDCEILRSFPSVHSFPVLRSLYLGSTSSLNEDHVHFFGMHKTSALRHLHLENLLPSTVTGTPWAQLTKLTLTMIPLGACLDALRWATSLQEFCRSLIPEELEQAPSTALSLRHTTLLTLDTFLSDENEDILPFLILPRLQNLKLDGDTYYRNLEARGVIPFLLRTSGTLRTFTIRMSPAVPVAWLHPLAQLATLVLDTGRRPAIVADVIRALDRRTSPDFLPRLECLEISESGSEQVDEALLDALASRCDETDAAHATLQSFSLIWPEFHDIEITRLPLINVLPLRALAKRGLRVHIGTRDVNNFY